MILMASSESSERCNIARSRGCTSLKPILGRFERIVPRALLNSENWVVGSCSVSMKLLFESLLNIPL